MKGVVFTEFLDMVEQQYSPAVADAVLTSCDLPSGGSYTAVGTYDSAEMAALVSALSTEVDVPPAVLLNAFGQRLFGRFVDMYPGFFPPGQTLPEFLDRLDPVIHLEVRKLYPDAETPTIAVRHEGGGHVVEYTSAREMPDLAEGLLTAAIRHFGSPHTMSRHDLPGTPPTTRFVLTPEPQDA